MITFGEYVREAKRRAGGWIESDAEFLAVVRREWEILRAQERQGDVRPDDGLVQILDDLQLPPRPARGSPADIRAEIEADDARRERERLVELPDSPPVDPRDLPDADDPVALALARIRSEDATRIAAQRLDRALARRVDSIMRRARARAETPIDPPPPRGWRRPTDDAVRNARPEAPRDRFVPPVDRDARPRKRWSRT